MLTPQLTAEVSTAMQPHIEEISLELRVDLNCGGEVELLLANVKQRIHRLVVAKKDDLEKIYTAQGNPSEMSSQAPLTAGKLDALAALLSDEDPGAMDQIDNRVFFGAVEAHIYQQVGQCVIRDDLAEQRKGRHGFYHGFYISPQSWSKALGRELGDKNPYLDEVKLTNLEASVRLFNSLSQPRVTGKDRKNAASLSQKIEGWSREANSRLLNPSLRQIYCCTPKELMNLQNFGKLTLGELQDNLEPYGICLLKD